MPESVRPHVVIVGGGFAGLNAAKRLNDAEVVVTIVDRRNHHVFQPLLYQVATASLSPADIAAPIRAVLRKQENLRVVLGEVQSINVAGKTLQLDDGELTYDYLILAPGVTHSYFGRDDWREVAPGLKTLNDAVEMRNRILLAFEAAERAQSEADRRRNLTFVVIGGGPTGVELSGAIAEIARHTLARDFDAIDPAQAQILLIEAGPRLLPTLPEKLSESARQDLLRLEVDVRLDSKVTGIDTTCVTLANGEEIAAETILWAAGVQGSPLGRSLGAELDRSGRVLVGQDLTLPGHPELFVAGDLAGLNDKDGRQYPGVAQVAMQQGRAAAANVVRQIEGRPTEPFRYRNLGIMATIGRNRAVADIRGLKLTGPIAWLVWLFIHILYLIGFRNRFIVMWHWVWGYFTFHRRVRLITGERRQPD